MPCIGREGTRSPATRSSTRAAIRSRASTTRPRSRRWERLGPLHETHACREWVESSKVLTLDRSLVPQLADVNVTLERSGFRMLPVAGLIQGRGFLSAMAQGVFLSTQYMRHHSVPFYTPEPDVIHELVGHAASLFHPDVELAQQAKGSRNTRRRDPLSAFSG